MKEIICLVISVILTLTFYGQEDRTLSSNKDRLCVGLNVGGVYPFYKQSFIGKADDNYNLSELSSYNNKGFLIGLNFNLQSQRRKHFIAQFDLNYLYTYQHLKYKNSYSSKVGGSHESGNFIFSASEANISVIPEIVFGSNIKIYVGLGAYINYLFCSAYKGQVVTSTMKLVNDSLSPVGVSIRSFSDIYDNNEIGDLSEPDFIMGAVLNLGIEVPYNNRNVIVMTRLYQSNNNYLISDVRKYMVAVNLVIPLIF